MYNPCEDSYILRITQPLATDFNFFEADESFANVITDLLYNVTTDTYAYISLCHQFILLFIWSSAPMGRKCVHENDW